MHDHRTGLLLSFLWAAAILVAPSPSAAGAGPAGEEGGAGPAGEEDPGGTETRAARAARAEAALDGGRPVEALDLSRALLLDAMWAPDAPANQARIVLALLVLDRLDEATTEAHRLLERYGPSGAWVRSTADAAAVAEAGSVVRRAVRAAAGALMERAAEAGGGSAAAAVAAGLLEDYLGSFPAGEASQEVRFRLADLYYRGELYELCYLLCLEALSLDPRSEYARQCCELAVFAAGRLAHEHATPGGARPAAIDDLDPWVRNQLDAMDLFLSLYPDHYRAPQVGLQAAELLLDHGLDDAAVTRLQAVIDVDPSSPQAVEAARLTLRCMERRGDWEHLLEVTRRLATTEGFGDAALREEIEATEDLASYRLIERRYVAAQDWSGAVDAFVAHADAHPDGRNADLALYNAIVYCYRLGDLTRATDLIGELRRRYPDSVYLRQLQL